MAFVARAAGKQQKIHSFAPLSEGVWMMEGNILKRDRQQFQINEELDLRTRLLMREADCIIKESSIERDTNESRLTADISSKILIFPNGSSASTSGTAKLSSSEGPDSSSTLPYRQSVEPELRFLRAKVKILTSEIDKQREDQKKKSDDIKLLESDLHLTRDERNKLVHQLGAAESKIIKMTASLKEQSDSIKLLESVKSKLSNELQAAKKGAKVSTQAASSMEVRMNRALEEAESLKSTLMNRRGQERDEHDSQRKMIENQCTHIQKLERQQGELILAFRRQMMLCHNLQRQKELMSSAVTLNMADKKFSELLSSKDDDGNKKKYTFVDHRGYFDCVFKI